MIATTASSQNLKTMNWLNEPASWQVSEDKLEMFVTPQSDYWRETHYGFTVDDGPFYYTTRGGEFEANLKITGEYTTRFDQMGMMLRVDEEHWIKTGIEYVDGQYNFSTVVTDTKSSWSVIQLSEQPASVWIKVIRRLDAVEIFYSLDGKNYTMSNLSYLKNNVPVKVGMMAASPDGEGFKAIFEDFSIKHLPDMKRLEWLERNKE
jgi:regulation of enolase protein 1 (concanavalin A-like superfamily)